ncbi:hypothetical protein DFR72_117126 [Lentzea flaviverrucosa]|uniref:Uncharacterized protein n=2 Tax=Lentzea flaviverrucosa TaxID=200379 RepID=A0A1H9XSN0_9PSEU|nr:hypothetical protein DFR72_117126 [Lentzea flaviverrucosa]SES49151.1 hypothetical protein SAMN05216195_11792 [Lentzea flaviverrucosa]
MHAELLWCLDSRLRSVAINRPQLIVDSLDERLGITIFRLGGEAAADRALWHIWQANRLDLHSEQAPKTRAAGAKLVSDCSGPGSKHCRTQTLQPQLQVTCRQTGESCVEHHAAFTGLSVNGSCFRTPRA